MGEKFFEVGGKLVPVRDLVNYANFLRGSSIFAKRLGVEAFDQERARLHNKIFNAAGFKDTQWGTARKTAAWFSTMTFRDTSMKADAGFDQALVDFKDALDEVIGKLLE
jgi:hypothetical protein